MAINTDTLSKSKTQIAKELGVSRSGLYYQPKLTEKDEKLRDLILKTWKDDEHPAYGHKRLAIALKINKKRILRVMKKYGLEVPRKRKPPRKPKDEKQEPTVIPNLLKDMTLVKRGQAWVSDFTYLWYFGRFAYLATVMDTYTKEIIGWAISFKHDTELIEKALLVALTKNSPPLIFHSDQGSEYRSERFQTLLKINNINPSMSTKGSPWQNGFQESFYGKFKLDLGHPECYRSLGELIEAIAKTIYYYNNKRIHTALKMPPAIFAKRLVDEKNIEIKNLHNSQNIIINKRPNENELSV